MIRLTTAVGFKRPQAQAYLDKVSGSADVVRMAAEIADLKQQLASLQADQPVASGVPFSFQEWDSDQIKDWIEQNTGGAASGKSRPCNACSARR